MPGISPCGRTNTRIKGWMGRADQTTKVRGMFVHPSQVADVARRHPEILRARLVISGSTGSDRMVLKVESRVRGEDPRQADRRFRARCDQAAQRRGMDRRGRPAERRQGHRRHPDIRVARAGAGLVSRLAAASVQGRFERSRTEKIPIPASMAATKIRACGIPAAAATSAGPGQKPASPQPTPNARLPARQTQVHLGGGRPMQGFAGQAETAPPQGSEAHACRQDRTGHHEGQRRVPEAGQVQKAQHPSGVRQAGDEQAESKHQARSESEKSGHVSLRSRGAAGRPWQSPPP